MKLACILVLGLVLAACNPLMVMTPKTETITFTVSAKDYTNIDGEDAIRVFNDEISVDREIEVYFYPYHEKYWGMVIDVDILIDDDGGKLVILDPGRNYEGSKIRIIVTWYEEEKHSFEGD